MVINPTVFGCCGAIIFGGTIHLADQEWVMASATAVTARMSGNSPRSVGMSVRSRGEQERRASAAGGVNAIVLGWSLDGLGWKHWDPQR